MLCYHRRYCDDEIYRIVFNFMFLYPGCAFDLTFFQSVAQDTLVQAFFVLLPALLCCLSLFYIYIYIYICYFHIVWVFLILLSVYDFYCLYFFGDLNSNT